MRCNVENAEAFYTPVADLWLVHKVQRTSHAKNHFLGSQDPWESQTSPCWGKKEKQLERRSRYSSCRTMDALNQVQACSTEMPSKTNIDTYIVLGIMLHIILLDICI